MIWLLLSSGIATLTLVILNIQPIWVQYLGFGVSLSLFITYLLRADANKSSNLIGKWIQKRTWVLATFLLLAVLSFLARRYEVVYDLSQYKNYSLRDQTITWLNKIDVPVQVLIFLQSDDKTVSYAEWLQKQTNRYTSHLKVEIKNINKEVLLTQKYNIHHAGEAVLVSDTNWVKTDGFKEENLVTGIMRLLSKTSSNICFLIGHGEPDITDIPNRGLFGVNQFLKNLGYNLKAVALDQSSAESLENGCGTLMEISPKKDFLPVEADRLATLMKNNKLPLFFALDPPVSQTVVELLQNEGLGLSSKLVINTANLAEKTPLTDIVLYPGAVATDILKNLAKKIFFPTVQSLSLAPPSEQQPLVWLPLLFTPPGSTIHVMGAEDKSDSLYLAASATDKQNQPKRIVFGSGKGLLADQFVFGDNQELLLEVTSWLLGETMLGWVDSREKDEAHMELSTDEAFWVKSISLYGFPSVFFLGTFFFWLKRRIGS